MPLAILGELDFPSIFIRQLNNFYRPAGERTHLTSQLDPRSAQEKELWAQALLNWRVVVCGKTEIRHARSVNSPKVPAPALLFAWIDALIVFPNSPGQQDADLRYGMFMVRTNTGEFLHQIYPCSKRNTPVEDH